MCGGWMGEGEIEIGLLKTGQVGGRRRGKDSSGKFHSSLIPAQDKI